MESNQLVSKVSRVAKSPSARPLFAPFIYAGWALVHLDQCNPGFDYSVRGKEVSCRKAAMPALTFLAVASLALIGLLFVVNAKLESGPPPIVTNQRSGLPEVRRPDVAQTFSAAPAPDMTSQAVRSAQPKSASDALANIGSAAKAARAEVPPKNRRAEAPSTNNRVLQTLNYQVTPLLDRFSIKGY